MIKVRVIQEMIQINRPVGWNINSVWKIANELKRIEKYNLVINHKIEKSGIG